MSTTTANTQNIVTQQTAGAFHTLVAANQGDNKLYEKVKCT